MTNDFDVSVQARMALDSHGTYGNPDEQRHLIAVQQRSLDDARTSECPGSRIQQMSRLYSSFDCEGTYSLKPPGARVSSYVDHSSNHQQAPLPAYVWHRSATLSSLRQAVNSQHRHHITPCNRSQRGRNMKHANSGNLVHQSSEERNPLVDVSNEYMRVSGYKPQFKSLLLKPGGSKTRLYEDSKSERAAKASGSKATDKQQNGPATRVVLPPDNEKLQMQCSIAEQEEVDRRRSVYARRNRSSHEMQTEMMELRHRLSQRKKLFWKRTKLSDVCVVFAAIGMILTVIESELTGFSIIRKSDAFSNSIKALIVASTIILLVLVFYYHQTEVQLLVIDSGTDDWRVAITWSRIIKLVIEEMICVICPFPGTGSFTWFRIKRGELETDTVYADVLLSIPMFLRCYLICRFMVLHSRLFQDAATRSIAALNHVSVDFKFVLKTMMMEEPLRVLLAFTVVWWIILSWLLAQCERVYGVSAEANAYENHGTFVFLNSLWFIVITFMSIGYGDVVPQTFCGRALGISTGIVGIGVASALIAVISRKLELTRAEKHVNAFMADTKLAREHKNAAARVLQEMWFIHKHRNSAFRDDMKVRLHQRRFLAAINAFRQVKWEQRRLGEQSNTLVDIGKIETDVREAIFEMQKSQNDILSEVQLLNSRLCELYAHMSQPPQPNLGNATNSSALIHANLHSMNPQQMFTRGSTLDRSDDGQSSQCSSSAINYASGSRGPYPLRSPNGNNPLMRAATIDRTGTGGEDQELIEGFKLAVPQSAVSLSNIDLNEERV